MLRANEEILEPDAGAACPGAEVMEEQGEPGVYALSVFSEEHFGIGSLTEQVPAQGLSVELDRARGPFVGRQPMDEFDYRVEVTRLGCAQRHRPHPTPRH